MIKVKISLIVLLSAVLCVLTANAQPTLSGSISGTLGPGTYIVTGNCTVDAGNSLVIEPGTTFLFSGHYHIKVFGSMTAEGTEQDSIIFTRQNPTSADEWAGIRYMNGSSNCTLSYAYIEYAKNHVYPDYKGGAVYIEEDGVCITNCWMKNNYNSYGGGIYVLGATVNISDCVFFGNSAGNGGGVYLYNSPDCNVKNSIFAKNSSTST